MFKDRVFVYRIIKRAILLINDLDIYTLPTPYVYTVPGFSLLLVVTCHLLAFQPIRFVTSAHGVIKLKVMHPEFSCNTWTTPSSGKNLIGCRARWRHSLAPNHRLCLGFKAQSPIFLAEKKTLNKYHVVVNIPRVTLVIYIMMCFDFCSTCSMSELHVRFSTSSGHFVPRMN